MALTFVSPNDKSAAITLVKTICSLMLFPHTLPEMKAKIVAHVQAMELNNKPLDVTCKLLTSADGCETAIALNFKFGTNQ